MAMPVILVDSATGSDTQASGAGPSTALFGTTDASTDGTGLIVTLTAGTDLTNVATDGSHVIFLNDTTAGARNFGKITAKAGSGGATPTVTVSNAFGLSLTTKSWAIGGKRASVGSTTSKKLFDNNSAVGDAMPGWWAELQSGHTETIAATYDFRRGGDTTDGPLGIRGASGAATLPIITFSNNGAAMSSRGGGIGLKDFELRNSNATKTASTAILCSSSGSFYVERMTVTHATNKFAAGVNFGNGTNTLKDSLIANCANIGVASAVVSKIIGNRIYSNGSHGVSLTTTNADVSHNHIYGNGGDGVNNAITGGSVIGYGTFAYNTIYGNTGDGIEITTLNIRAWTASILNNILANNGAYGLALTGGNDLSMDALMLTVAGNCFYSNTSGPHNPSTLPSVEGGISGTNPAFADTGSGDFTPTNTAIRGTTYPLSFGSVTNYGYPGAIQPNLASAVATAHIGL